MSKFEITKLSLLFHNCYFMLMIVYMMKSRELNSSAHRFSVAKIMEPNHQSV